MNLIKRFIELTDPDWVEKHIINLYRLERNQTFPYYNKAARYVYDLLCENGFDSEFIEFPADGKTAYQDKCSPIGWDASNVRLEVLGEIPHLSDPVIADFSREPLSVVKHSVSTPPEGITTRLVTEAQMKSGEDVTGAFVLLDQSTRPGGAAMTMLLDLGALGWVSDFHEEGCDDDVDAIFWCNAGTENGNWGVIADVRDYLSFQVSPRVGYALRSACEKKTVMVHAVSDGRRYETVLPAVTALLPGQDPREVWVISHLYEPLIDDNSNGVISSIANLLSLRCLVEEGAISLKYSVRVVFAAELYGVAAVADYFGGDLSKVCVGAINTDGTTAGYDKSVHKEYNANFAPNVPGFVGNVLMETVLDRFCSVFPYVTIHKRAPQYGDDMFLSDSSTGLPTVWFRHSSKGHHHHSTQNESALDVKGCIEHLSYQGEWIRAMAATTEEEVRELLPAAVERANATLTAAAQTDVREGTDLRERLLFLQNREQEKIRGLRLYCHIPEIEEACAQVLLPKPENKTVAAEHHWFDYAEQFVFTRLYCGFPKDLMFLPKHKRIQLPGWVLYSTLADVFSRMDGQKTLRRILQETEWDLNILFDEKTVKQYLYSIIMLANAGYLKMEAQNPLTAQDLTAALQALGVKEGDTLLVHSSLSNLGYLENGADGIIEALAAAVGPTGTFLAPAFARPYIYFEGLCHKSYSYRPYDTRPDGALRDKTIETGALPKAMLKRADAVRSGHVSHEWVALGADAAACVAGHGFLDDPANENSPMAKVLERDGSVVFIGCDISANTFIHYVEHMVEAPFLHPALVTYLDEKGHVQTAYIRKHLAGCRDFYRGESGRFYQEMIRRGLTIHKQPVGQTMLYRIALRELFDIAAAIYREHPTGMLCLEEGCLYCRKYNSDITR